MSKKFVLFDFDGVIANNFATAFEVNKMICPHITEYDYRKRFEGNINDWRDVPCNHTDKCRHDIDFFAEYIPRMKQSIKMVRGIDEVIKKLSKIYTLIIVSSTLTSPIQEFIEEYGLKKYFNEIMGNDIHASKTEKIKMVFLKYGISAGECVFIADTLGDIREAKEAGVGSIGVSWGFHDSQTLQRGNPFKIVEKPQDLYVTVRDYFNMLLAV